MTIRNERDWVLPALLIVGVLLVAAAFAAGFALGNREDAADDDVDADGLGDRLGAYTECLRDNGADVPLVETEDGEVSITFFPGDVDPEALRDAIEACEDLAPGVISGLLGTVLRDHEADASRPRGPWFLHEPEDRKRFPRFGRHFEEFCELFEEGFIPPDSAIYDELAEACAEG